MSRVHPSNEWSPSINLVSKIRRAGGVATVQEMGGQVAIEWVGYPRFTKVCWIAFDQSEFDERQLDELIAALKRIGVRRYVISQGNPTTIDRTVMQRMWREVGNIRFGHHEKFKGRPGS
jgi:hypothetical protein